MQVSRKPQIIRVSGANAKEFAKARVTETEGKDISTLPMLIGLALVTESYPTVMAAPGFDHSIEPSVRVIGHLVTSSTPLAEYELWVRILDDPEEVPRKAGRVNVI